MSDSTLSTTTSTSSVSDWATEIAGQAEAPSKHRPRRGLAAIGAAMVGGPLAMTAWFLVEPSVLPREDADVFLASVATSPDRYLIGTVFMALAAALTVLSAFGFARLLGDRLPRLGLVVGVLMFLSGIGLAAQVGFRAVVWSLVGEGTVPASSIESFHAFQTSGLFDILVAPGLVFGGLATLLTVGALLRTRLVSWWVPVAMLVGMVLASGEFPDPVTVGGAALGAAANLVLARTLLARS